MSLQTRLTSFVQAVGADIKALNTRIDTLPGGGGPTLTLKELAADQVFTSTSLADISDWVVPLPANGVVTIDAVLVLSSAATTTGWQFNAITRNVGNTANLTPSRFLVTYEYQSSATAWTTQTQTVHTTPPALITAAYVANAGIMCRITGQIEVGATAGELRFQMKTEVNNSAITLRRGSPLRVM